MTIDDPNHQWCPGHDYGDPGYPPSECAACKALNSITMDSYQESTETTAVYPSKGTIVGLMYAALGLGEAGEVQNKVKKIVRDANGVVTDDTRAKIASELGDLLWYVGRMCTELGLSMGDVAKANLAKLADRKARGVIKGEGDKR